jgi:thiol-disulfide isomerase/thioredoxin
LASRAPLLAVLVACLPACATGGADSTSTPPASAVAESALGQMSLSDLDGRRVRLGDLLGRQVLFVTFWATWCEPCKAELKHLTRLQRTLRPRGLTVVAVNTDPPATQGLVRGFIRRHGPGLLVLMDQESRLLAELNPKATLPYYVIFDRRGSVVARHQGFQPGDEKVIERELSRLLAQR